MLINKEFNNYNLYKQAKFIQNLVYLVQCIDDMLLLEQTVNIETKLPNSEMIILDNCVHYPFIENKNFIKLLRIFLE